MTYTFFFLLLHHPFCGLVTYFHHIFSYSLLAFYSLRRAHTKKKKKKSSKSKATSFIFVSPILVSIGKNITKNLTKILTLWTPLLPGIKHHIILWNNRAQLKHLHNHYPVITWASIHYVHRNN